MSNTNVVEGFINNAETFLRQHGLLNQSHRLFNIDETWFSPTEEKRQKVIVPKTNKVPYKVLNSPSEHITLTMGASASGQWLPPLFIFKGTVPTSDNSFMTLGPDNALFAATESGHIDSVIYLNYIKHVERFLGNERPVCIFQDNLGAHESYELVQFCTQKQIHLFNMPAKTSHILQPMDKLFGPLKKKFAVQRQKSLHVSPCGISKKKVPILTKFAMNDISQQTIIDAFAETGICPLSFDAISKDTLVGDDQQSTAETEAAEKQSQNVSNEHSIPLEMEAEAVEDNSFEVNLSDNFKTTGIQTDPIRSLPCPVCIKNDVSLHPAVQAGLVDLEFASALLSDESSIISNSGGSGRTRIRRDCSKGRCLTAESEMMRLEKIRLEEQERERLKKQKKDEKERREAEKRKAISEAEREKEAKRKRDERVHEIMNIGRMMKGRMCFSCSTKIGKADTVKCALCCKTFHKLCIGETSSVNTICPLCQFVSNE